MNWRLLGASQAGELPRTLAIDGKSIGGYSGPIVAQVDTEEGTPVALGAAIARLWGAARRYKTHSMLGNRRCAR